MKSTQLAFVSIPNFLKLTDNNLNYLDILVYASLRSFDTKKGGECFPKHETVGKLVGLSKRFVNDSIKRLEDAGYIAVTRSSVIRRSNEYYFPILKRYDEIPIGLLIDDGLTKCEKAMLMALRQFFIHGTVTCIDPLTLIVDRLGLTYETVNAQVKSLVRKGYILKKFMPRYNFKKQQYQYKLTDKVKWLYMPCLKQIVKKYDLVPNLYTEPTFKFIVGPNRRLNQ